MSSPVDAPRVRIAAFGGIGRITLNRPEKLNALDTAMVRTVQGALDTWRGDDSITALVIDGAGDRGLCAGGDIAAVYDGILAKNSVPHDFWTAEYAMNANLGCYPKPIVSLMHGITFGGGIGLAGHVSHRVVTDSSILAMPETLIGLCPDVGGLYLLARSPGELGTHAALTGQRLGPGDAIAMGLADFYLPHERWAQVQEKLSGIGTGREVDDVMSTLARPAPDAQWVQRNRGWIDECYAGDDIHVIVQRLAGHAEPAARAAADTICAMSPTAVAVALRAIRNAAAMTLPEVLAQDYRLSMAFAAHGDFAEGTRAQVVDKDRAPRWRPATLAEVSAADVAAFFADGDGHLIRPQG